MDVPVGSYTFKWYALIYGEISRRVGVAFQFESYALKRMGLQIEAGVLDGEANRAYGYGLTQPNLVRVEESIVDLSLALYTANPALRLQRLEDLASNGMQVEYRRGILLCENALKPLVPEDRLSDVATADQGLKKLMAQRTDLFCDFSLSVLPALHTPEMAANKATANIRKVLDLGTAIPTYPYVNKKYAPLALRMAAALKQMKAEGLIEAYRQQVEKELGWNQ